MREHTLLKAGDRERAYVERLDDGTFFSEVVYGVMNDKVSFVYLVGPRVPPQYPVELVRQGAG